MLWECGEKIDDDWKSERRLCRGGGLLKCENNFGRKMGKQGMPC